ncbi:hypothetical protein HMPREF0860_1834 [Treponema socranskii subsp. socranskii VPI DR56BR1116 = ATCC 35536]|uniref:Uncharacterized protein n=1 Tax=Treponema socranskii subsp. socranskii VPI DR56BR1116 = ATCC 35536 TaxID=1125725 RepID=U1FJX7_TRESO|nr:hypothetical protein HMPREF1325_0436 [Treponema socranskii subsp. socranskii VPI DR56BR1116 = ATCC 35536]ERJ98953.1 hypothetical protein HMPREF0860_1834 [Treponema socranskii subsp. socranskii VPI DR56BR1116 = ATCC 35536]
MIAFSGPNIGLQYFIKYRETVDICSNLIGINNFVALAEAPHDIFIKISCGFNMRLCDDCTL